MGRRSGRIVQQLALVGMVPFLLGSIDPRAYMEERLLAAHNRERSAIGVPELRWDPELAEGAAKWAEHLSRSSRFEHSPTDPAAEPIGENIWGGTPAAYSPERMVGLWIAEKQHYRPGRFPATSLTGEVADVSHYTQLIWRDTTHVGCAVSDAGDEEVLVCRYRTAGNVMGESVT